jgi:hypothetical protein
LFDRFLFLSILFDGDDVPVVVLFVEVVVPNQGSGLTAFDLDRGRFNDVCHHLLVLKRSYNRLTKEKVKK